ncbi:MAG: DUF1580 domain-containing protein [Planctomycetes bacterium]|nr:DUF1580 domain-containing protein [Planctomycetota bacterium]
MVSSGLLAQDPLTLIEASKILPGRPHRNTLIRWCDSGVNGIRLKSFRVGRRRCTTMPWLEEFLAAVSKTQEKLQPLPTSHVAAESRLDEMGV